MAIDWDILKAHFLQMQLSEQIQSLTLNLARLQTLANSHADTAIASQAIEKIAQHHLRESQHFIEWIVPTLDLVTHPELATQLIDLQRQLSRWKLDLRSHWATEQTRQQLAQAALDWSQRLSPITPLIAG